MKSDTPKTDAEQEAIPWIHDTRRFIVDAEFARTLERELNAERGARERAVEKFDCAEALLQTNSVISARLRAELVQEKEWRMEKLHACKAAAENSAVSVYYREGGKFDSEAAAAVRALYKNFLTSQASCVLRMLEADVARDALRILRAADYEALTGGADYGLLKLRLEAAKSENEALRAEIQSALEGDPRNHQ